MPRDKTGHFYFAWYPTIYQQDTQSLTLAEDGAYRRLIDHYMLTRAPLPHDDRALSRIVGCGINEWISIKDNVIQYFKPSGLENRTQLVHSFCEIELLQDNKRINTARENGRLGGRKHLKSTTKTQSVPKTNPVGSPNTTQTNTNQHNTDIKTLPNLTNGKEVNGFSKIKFNGSGGFEEGFRFMPSERTQQDILSIAPGWNIQVLVGYYQDFIRQHGKPDHPQAAFKGWARSFTKGQPPQ